MKTSHTHIIVAVIVVIVAFWAGYNHGKSVSAAVATTAGSGRTFTGTGAGSGGFTGTRGAGARGGASGGAGFITGTIVAMDADSISVQSMATTSGSQVVLYSPSTSIMKTVTGSAADLMVGSTVVVTGTANSDGSESANSIQIRPSMTAQAEQ